MIFGTYLTSQRLVRTDSHKLIYYPELDRFQLFDLQRDPHEITDVVDEPAYAAVRAELTVALNQTRKDLGDGLSQ